MNIRSLFSAKVKRVALILVAIIICVSVLLSSYHFFASWVYNMNFYEMELFYEYRSYFKFLVDELYPYFEEKYAEDDDLIAVGIHAYTDIMRISYYYGDETKDISNVEVQMSDGIKESFAKIKEAFLRSNSTYGEFECVSVMKNTVSFRRNVYGLVYTENAMHPQYIASPRYDKDLYVKRISLHWFHCIPKDF